MRKKKTDPQFKNSLKHPQFKQGAGTTTPTLQPNLSFGVSFRLVDSAPKFHPAKNPWARAGRVQHQGVGEAQQHHGALEETCWEAAGPRWKTSNCVPQACVPFFYVFFFWGGGGGGFLVHWFIPRTFKPQDCPEVSSKPRTGLKKRQTDARKLLDISPKGKTTLDMEPDAGS